MIRPKNSKKHQILQRNTENTSCLGDGRAHFGDICSYL